MKIAKISSFEARQLEKKLLTSQAFTEVKARFVFLRAKKAYRLIFSCKEKWTKIPVIRGVFGGGTPLLVLGGYDIHSFGRLLVFGAEFRRYGKIDPGWVLYAKAPRYRQGKHLLGFCWACQVHC